MSSKQERFKGLTRSSSGGSNEVKEDMVTNAQQRTPKTPADSLVKIVGKKKATFEMDPELHQWLKIHSIRTGRNMVEIVEELIQRLKDELEE